MVVQRKRRTSISISIYAVIENYHRDLDKYYCQHLIILLGSSNRNCSIKSIQKGGEGERERETRRERKGKDICARKKWLKSESEWSERRIVIKKRERERKKRMTIVDRYIKQVDVYLRVNKKK